MKTIELICGGNKVQFTTKSVTFDGKEFFYSKMSNVSQDAEKCSYTFTYDDEIKVLPYNAKDAKVLAAIFSQVQMLEKKKKETVVNATTANHHSEDEPTSDITANADMTSDVSAVSKPDAKPDSHQEIDQEGKKADLKSEKEKLKIEKQAEKEKLKAEKQVAKEKRKADKLAKKEKSASENEDAHPDRKVRTKKSLIVFGIILVAFVVIAVIYFFIFGTADEPSQIAPNSTESQQYDDIDEIIDDLQ